MLTKEIEQQIKLTLIKNFINENNRVPNSGELNELIINYNKNHSLVDGINQYNDVLRINEESSYSKYNLLFDDISSNINLLSSYLEKLKSKIQNRMYSNLDYLSNLESDYSSLNNKLSQILLSTGLSTNLISLIYEDFSNLKYLYENTNVNIQQNNIYSDYSSLETLEIDYNIEYYLSNSSFLYTKEAGTISSLKELDSKYWSIEVFSEDKKPVTLILKLSFNDIESFNHLNLGLDSHTGTSIVLSSSNDDTNYNIINSLNINSNIVNIPFNGEAKYLLLAITKTLPSKYDGKNYLFDFKFDYISFSNSEFSSESEVIMGPYTLVDIFNDPINFSYLKFESCTTINDNSAIQFYLSYDLDSWIPINNNDGSSILYVNSASIVDEYVQINDDYQDTNSDADNIDSVLLTDSQIVLNQKLPISLLDKINLYNIDLRRGLPSDLTVFDTDSGWFYNPSKQTYNTTILVNNASNVILDLGYTSAYIDGVYQTGKVFLSNGFHSFETNQANWIEIEDSISSESLLKAQDPLYPYNHKYLIEGYNYISSFVGQKNYSSIGEYFSHKVKYVSDSEMSTSNDLDIFTFKIKDDYIYIVLNTNKDYSDWQNELFKINIYLNNNITYNIYIKCKFISYDNVSSSNLHNFTIKVI